MGRFSNVSNRLLFAIKDFRDNTKERSKEYGHRILKPKSFEKFRPPDEGVDRVAQILALIAVPIVIVVSLALITALNEVMTEIFGTADLESGGQVGILGWFVTAVTGGLFLLCAWGWFQFVRTYGFGFLRLQ